MCMLRLHCMHITVEHTREMRGREGGRGLRERDREKGAREGGEGRYGGGREGLSLLYMVINNILLEVKFTSILAVNKRGENLNTLITL